MPEENIPQKGSGTPRESMLPTDDPIGVALRRLHDAVVAEPLPDDFLRLLGEIERKLDAAQETE